MPTSSSPDRPLRPDVFRSLRRRGLLSGVEAAWVLAVANTIAKQRFRAVTFRDGTLICVAGSLPAAELQLGSGQFREAVNKKLGRDLVQKIRFKARSE